ncbi:hypothetical protein KSF_085900 [Reticulibacter mediterranei]|uniref:HTH cro/C1-type domain-containing protein n=1 Tax=Reticulibacter mediterranei TaxID=2778369 RepID=A0A8J3N4T1_9CHLR|nr:helix-turn-helix transcriptional regulator [Reticulibacter mediterranei]GHO98542.1 hypothetical protein KSF_085900 [Reticulibacter mediterranei]
MVDKIDFGALVKTYRKQCGWNQKELGEKIGGVHRNTIYSWEQGTIPPRDVVLQLADVFELSAEQRKAFLQVAGIEQIPTNYWHVPFSRNPYFLGREEILQTLRKRLVSGAKTTALTQSISGRRHRQDPGCHRIRPSLCPGL